jgi:hypothetical protein
MNGFETVEVILKLAIFPMNSTNPMDAVKQQLHNILFKYNDAISGIPLFFNNLKFPADKKFGRIIADKPWIHIDISAQFTIFKPFVGLNLIGKINKVV